MHYVLYNSDNESGRVGQGSDIRKLCRYLRIFANTYGYIFSFKLINTNNLEKIEINLFFKTFLHNI